MSHNPSFLSPASATTILARLTNDEITNVVMCAPVYSDGPLTFKMALGDGSAKSKVAGVVCDQLIAPATQGAVLRTGVHTATTAQWDAVCGTSGGLTYGVLYYLSTSVSGVLVTSSASAVPVVFGLGPTVGAIVIGSGSGGGSGTITGVTAGTGLSGGGTSGGVTLALANTAVTPGVYTNLNATIAADGRVTAASNGSGSGGGITNSAPNATVMLSNGTNAVASGLTDDGSIVSMTARKLQVGTAAVPTNNKAFFSLCDAATTTQLYVQQTDTNHVGTGAGNNEAINIVCDQKATFDTTLNPAGASANSLTALCSSSRVAGSGLLTNAAIIAQAVNGDINYCFLGVPGGGKIRCDDGVTAGPIDCTNFTTSATVTMVGTTGSSINLTGTASISGTSSIGGCTFSGGGATLGTAGSLKAVNYIEFNSAGTEVDIYHTFANTGSAGNKAININSAGTSPVRINSNFDGIAHSGTGGLEVYAGNNGSTVKGAITAAGRTWGTTLGILGSGVTISAGAGSPAGVVTGSPGDLYLNTSGGAGTTLYVKESGTATTAGWVGK